MITRDEISWLYKCLLSREADEEAIQSYNLDQTTFNQVRNNLIDSEEFYLQIKDRLSDFSASYIACDYPTRAYSPLSKRTSLALVCIAKDEETNISRMIQSCLPIVDFIAVLDTGSSDNTMKLARAACGDMPSKIERIDFIDFSTSRNLALALARGETDWVLMLDADEYLVEEDYVSLVGLINYDCGVDGWRLPRYNFVDSERLARTYRYPDYQKRLLRNRNDIYYAGKVHEWVVGVNKWGFAPTSEIAFGGSCGGPHIHHTALVNLDERRATQKFDFYESLGARQKVQHRPPTILIQNYHHGATAALIRDFKKIGFHVVSPADDWKCISWFAPNNDLDTELISFEEYMRLPQGHILIGCKQQEADLVPIAEKHNDQIILNVAQHQHLHPYADNLGKIMICPDIITYENYPYVVENKLLYFPRPHLKLSPQKDVKAAYDRKRIASYISVPRFWPRGTSALDEFCHKYPHQTNRFGQEAQDGILDRATCNLWMSDSFFTVHFKELEAYGLSCLESMMLGTPVASLNSFMHDKTLGRFFLKPDNSIVCDTMEELIDRLINLTIDEYAILSKNAQSHVMEMTRDEVTVDRLRQAVYGK